VDIARKILPFTSVLLILVVLRTGWIFYSRQQDARAAEARVKAKEAAAAQYVVDKYGSGRAKVLGFSVSNTEIRRGETAQLCYSVSNAKTVKIEPPVGEVWPSMSRCLEVQPEKNTEYTITIEDAARRTDTAKATIKVK